MGQGGVREHRSTQRRYWYTTWDQARTRFLWGCVGAAAVIMICMLLNGADPGAAVNFGAFCFVVAFWVVGCDMSVQAFLSLTPTLAATFGFLQFLAHYPT